MEIFVIKTIPVKAIDAFINIYYYYIVKGGILWHYMRFRLRKVIKETV